VAPDEAVVLVRALVNTVAGFLVQALRGSGTRAPGLALGDDAAAAVEPRYVKAVTRPVDLETVLDESLRRLIDN
jgi:hypothetical protein